MSRWLPDYGDLNVPQPIEVDHGRYPEVDHRGYPNRPRPAERRSAPPAEPPRVPRYPNPPTPPRQPSPPRHQPEPNNPRDAFDYQRMPEEILNDPSKAQIESIILSKAQRPDETVSLQNSGAPARILAAITSLEARATVRYGRATYDVHVSGNRPLRAATGSWLERNILGPLKDILRNPRAYPRPAEDPQFQTLMDHLCQLILGGCNKWICPIISNAKNYSDQVQLIEPPGGMTGETLVPYPMTVWLDHRLYEELAEVVPNGGGYDVRFFRANEPSRGFDFVHNADGFVDHNWTNRPDREYPVDPQFRAWI